MSFFKCKMCGGTIEFEPGATVGVCDSCGTKQTLPKTSDDVLTNLFNRANNLRLKCEFDKAEQVYEKIVQEDDSEAEAHWGIVLCKYGIEYVEDPKTRKRIPTCHRTLFEAVTADPDYQAAIDYSDPSQQSIYESEARAIDRIQKDILKIVKNEKPFDVFICYKETDEAGKRTIDSAIANDIYYQLTNEGFKVFYAAVTLEDKLGQEYEPYIFAALNSAKVMLVIGTKPEFFNAVWVKNEWSRFMNLMKTDRAKLLIPCYRDMDAYDLPEEFAHLQAQDMSKIGFINDVTRGIKKVISDETAKPAAEPVVTAIPVANQNAAPLLKRAFMFLEDGEWDKVDDFCEQVLNIDPENAQAYLGKLMAELKVHKQEQLADCEQPFDGNSNYQKALRFSDDNLEPVLRGYITHINERNENARLTGIYNNAVSAMKAAFSVVTYLNAAELFKSIPGFKDADALTEQCFEKAEICRKDYIYSKACSQMTGNLAGGYESAINMFRTIPGWKDADEQIAVCQKKIEEIKVKQEAARLERERKAEERRIADEKAAKKRKKIAAIVTPIVVVCIAFLIVLTTVIIPKQKLNKAMGLLDSGDYEAAYALLEEIGNSDAIASSKYDRAVALIDSGDYEAAYALLEEIGNSDAIASSKYDRAVALIDSGDYEAAYMLLNGLNYKDSANKLSSIKLILLSKAQVGSYVYFGAYEQDNNTSNGKEDIEWLVLAKEGDKALVISKYALDCQQYNTSYNGVTWATCSLRKWLNGTFLSAAFSSEEQNSIISSTVTADKNPSYSTSPGNNTTDKVFLLSITEVNKYFNSDDARKCAPTDYGIAQGAWTDDSNKTGGRATCWWWLRSPGFDSSNAAYVIHGGSVNIYGHDVNNVNFGVRPALWINLGS